MEGSNEDKFSKEVCDLKHHSVEDRLSEHEDKLEEIIKPGSGHLAVLKSELERRIEQQDSKVNGLIMAFVTIMSGTAIAIGGEFIKKFVK